MNWWHNFTGAFWSDADMVSEQHVKFMTDGIGDVIFAWAGVYRLASPIDVGIN